MRRPALVAGPHRRLPDPVRAARAVPLADARLEQGPALAVRRPCRGSSCSSARSGPGTITPLIAVVDSGRPGGIAAAAPAIAPPRRGSCAPIPRSRSCRRRPSPGCRPTCRPTRRGRYARIVVSTKHDYGTDQAKKLAKRFRGTYVPGGAASAARACTPAAARPRASTSSTAPTALFPWLVLGVLAVTYLVLMRAFRSLLLPLKAVILNLLSVGATYGLLVVDVPLGRRAASSACRRPTRSRPGSRSSCSRCSSASRWTTRCSCSRACASCTTRRATPSAPSRSGSCARAGS